MHLAVVLLLVSIVSAILGRVSTRLGLVASHTPSVFHGHVLVLFVAPVHDAAWRDALWHMLTQAASPPNVRFGVLLECTSETDLSEEVDTELRHVARVVHVPRRSHHDPAHRMKRILKRFVKGDEVAVVVADYRVRLAQGWDATVVRLVGGSRLLTAPAAGHAFPTRTADGGRGASRAFQTSPALASTPSVCWCAEFTAGTPSAFGVRPQKYRVPCLPLVESDERLEAECASAVERVAASKEERVGLSPRSSDAERIRKFGSSRAARLAVEFVT